MAVKRLNEITSATGSAEVKMKCKGDCMRDSIDSDAKIYE